jgi:hypothetical protein
MLEQERFGDDRADAAGSHSADRGDDQMRYQDEPIPHAVNNGGQGRGSQVWDSVAECGTIAIRHGQATQAPR